MDKWKEIEPSRRKPMCKASGGRSGGWWYVCLASFRKRPLWLVREGMGRWKERPYDQIRRALHTMERPCHDGIMCISPFCSPEVPSQGARHPPLIIWTLALPLHSRAHTIFDSCAELSHAPSLQASSFLCALGYAISSALNMHLGM